MTLGSDGSETKVAAWRATAGVCGACKEKDIRWASSGLASNLRDRRIRGRAWRYWLGPSHSWEAKGGENPNHLCINELFLEPPKP